MKLTEFRAKNPAYDNVDDLKLTNALYEKYYADKMYVDEFRAAIDYNPIKATVEESPTGRTAPTVTYSGPKEMKPARGFAENIQSFETNVKEYSIIGNAIKYAMTPQYQYDYKNAEMSKLNKNIAIPSTPILANLNETLEKYRELDYAGELTPEQDEEYTKLETAYSDVYKKLEVAYDKGDLDGSFSFTDLYRSFEDDPGGMAAEFLNSMMGAPELLLTPVGWELAAVKSGVIAARLGAAGKVLATAKVTGGIAGSSALGATLASAASVSEQLAKTGKVDTEQVKLAAKVGGITAPLLIGSFKGLKNASKTVLQGAKAEYNTIVGSVVAGPSRKSIGKITPDEQLKLKEELLPIAGNKLSRKDSNNLDYEVKDLEYKLDKLTDTNSPGNVSAAKDIAKVTRTSRKNAQRQVAKDTTEDVALIKERIAILKSKIENNQVAVAAEKALSRVEQGLVPEKLPIDAKPAIALGGTRVEITRPVVDKYISKIGTKAAGWISRGLNEEVAIERATNSVVKSTALREALYAQNKLITKELPNPDDIPVGSVLSKITTAIDHGTYPLRSGLSRIFSPVATQLSSINRALGFAVQRHDLDLALRIKSALEHKAAFADKVWKTLSKEQQSKMNHALANNNRDKALSVIDTDAYATELLKRIFKYLDDTELEAEELGVTMGSVKDYFPRSIKDYEGYIKSRGYTVSDLQTSLATAINKKYKITNPDHMYSKSEPVDSAKEYLTASEFSGAVNKTMAGTFREQNIRAGSNAAKRRTMAEVTAADLNTYYHDPITSLTNYVAAMSMKLETRRFFGGKQMDKGGEGALGKTNESGINTSIGDLTAKLLDSGQILQEDIGRVQYLLNARFVGGAKAPNAFIGTMRDIGYAITIANPLSAGTQLGDLGAAVYLNGVMPTVRATVDKLNPGKKITKMEDYGLTNLVEELEHLRPTARLLDRALSLSTFKLVDRLGKETVLNSTMSKIQSQLKTTKGTDKVIAKYKDAFTPEAFQQAMVDMKNGVLTPDTKFMLWTQLARVQPISLSEMPPAYLNNPNARVFYMLKSFTIKQLDLLRRDAYDEIKKGNLIRGGSNLVRHMSILGVANASVQTSKDWVQGKDTEFSDVLMATVMRNYGLSEYIAKDFADGKPLQAIAKTAMPPLSAYDNVISPLWTGDFYKAVGHLPPYGKLLQLMMEDPNYE